MEEINERTPEKHAKKHPLKVLYLKCHNLFNEIDLRKPLSWPVSFIQKCPGSVLLYLFYLLVDLLVSRMESQGPQKQMSGAFRRTSIFQLTLGCHYPQGLKGRGNKSLFLAFINPLFCLSTHIDMIVSGTKFKIPGLSECIASIEENTLLIWPLVA